MGIAAHFRAVERVRQRLKRVGNALDARSISYAIVGDNAVASWVSRVDPAATRAARDIDVLVRRADLVQLSEAITALGFTREDMRDLVLFIDPDEPSKRAGVHLVWANERLRPSYAIPSPSVEEAVRNSEGYFIVDLPALVRMKLTSNRPIDQAHVLDLISVGLVDDRVTSSLPDELMQRLEAVRQHYES